MISCYGDDCIDSTSAGQDTNNGDASSNDKRSDGATGKGQMKYQGNGGSATKEHDEMEKLNVSESSSQAHKSSKQSILDRKQSNNLFTNFGSGTSGFGRGTVEANQQNGFSSGLTGGGSRGSGDIDINSARGGGFVGGQGFGGGGGPRINCWSCRRSDVRCNAQCLPTYRTHYFR